MKNYGLILCLLLCTACVSVPKKLALPENVNTISFSEAQSLTENVIGQKARWGGVIAEIKNNAKTTMLEIVNFPLASSLRPEKGDETLGRFRLYFNGLLDPMIYKKGRSISALGTVGKQENGTIGEHEYNFPVLLDASVHLWEKSQRVDVGLIHQPFLRYNDPFWGFRSHVNYGRPIIVRSSSSQSKVSPRNAPPTRSNTSPEKTK